MNALIDSARHCAGFEVPVILLGEAQETLDQLAVTERALA